jgi:hypothetical protein
VRLIYRPLIKGLSVSLLQNAAAIKIAPQQIAPDDRLPAHRFKVNSHALIQSYSFLLRLNAATSEIKLIRITILST